MFPGDNATTISKDGAGGIGGARSPSAPSAAASGGPTSDKTNATGEPSKKRGPELKDLKDLVSSATLRFQGKKKQQATVKPIKASDDRFDNFLTLIIN